MSPVSFTNDDAGPGTFGDNSFHVITTAGTNPSAVIDGFVVRGGNANGGGSNDRGAGILCLGAVSPTVRNCFFRENRCTFGGAAGYVNNGGAPSFTVGTGVLQSGGLTFGTYLVIANHQSWADSFLIQTAIVHEGPILKVLVKEELMRYPILGISQRRDEK